jgi:hypothetical protein
MTNDEGMTKPESSHLFFEPLNGIIIRALHRHSSFVLRHLRCVPNKIVDVKT